MEDNWLKQQDEPLFSDILWSKPERKSARGKLLIIGGHLHGFERAATAFLNATEAGAGEVKVVLPDKLKPVLAGSLETAVFTASTNSGTLAKDSYDELMAFAEWADAVLLVQPGDNSETSLAITQFISQNTKPLVIGDDVLSVIKHDMSSLLKPPLMLALSIGGLQALLKGLGSSYSLRHDMGLRPLVLALTEEAKLEGFGIATVSGPDVVTVAGGKAVTTRRNKQPQLDALAAWLAVWWMWQPNKLLEAMATAAFEF